MLENASNCYFNLCFEKERLEPPKNTDTKDLDVSNRDELKRKESEYTYISKIIEGAANFSYNELPKVIVYLISMIENKEYIYIGNYKIYDELEKKVVDFRLFPYVIKFINLLTDFKTYKAYNYGYPVNEELTYEELYNLANEFIEERKGIEKIK